MQLMTTFKGISDVKAQKLLEAARKMLNDGFVTVRQVAVVRKLRAMRNLAFQQKRPLRW